MTFRFYIFTLPDFYSYPSQKLDPNENSETTFFSLILYKLNLNLFKCDKTPFFYKHV